MKSETLWNQLKFWLRWIGSILSLMLSVFSFGIVSSTWLIAIFLWYLYWKHQHRDHVVGPSFTIILRNSFSYWPFGEGQATGWLGSNEYETRVALEYWSTIVSPWVHKVHLVASCTNNNTQNMNTCGGAVVSANLIRLETLLWETVVWSWRRRARWQCRASWAPPA